MGWIPFAASQYRPGSDRVTDILMEQGRIAGMGSQRQGDIWGSTVAGLGQQAAGTVADIQQAQQMAKRDAALDAALSTWDGKDPRALFDSLKMLDPKSRLDVTNGMVAFSRLGQKDEAAERKDFDASLVGIARLPYPVFAKYWGAPGGIREKMAAGAAKFYGIPELPDQADEQTYEMARQLAGQKSGEGFTLGENQVRFGPDGKEIARGPVAAPKPAAPPAVGSFEDYMTATPERQAAIEAGRKRYGQADDRALAPVVVVTADGPQLVDRTTKTAAPIQNAGGGTVGPVPTADERNRATARTSAQPVLDSIDELSEKINKSQGVIARIVGAAEKAAAQANLSDDVAEYEAVVSGFTPMLARMVGHTGVLTEQDVQSVRRMLPDPRDSKSVRDRKMARIRTILGAQPGGGTAPRAGEEDKKGDPLGIR